MKHKTTSLSQEVIMEKLLQENTFISNCIIANTVGSGC